MNAWPSFYMNYCYAKEPILVKFFYSSLMYRDKVRFLSCIRQKKQLLVSKLMQLLFLQLGNKNFFIKRYQKINIIKKNFFIAKKWLSYNLPILTAPSSNSGACVGG